MISRIYATWNPADKGSTVSLTNGDLTVSPGGTSWKGVRSTISKSSGKWYWEYTMGTVSNIMAGISSSTRSVNSYPANTGDGRELYNSGNHYPAAAAYNFSFTTGDNIGVALDMDTGYVTLYKNGVAGGAIAIGISGAAFASCSPYDCGLTANFGATAFTYPVPSGFNAGLYT
jgi:hypothetical protein